MTHSTSARVESRTDTTRVISPTRVRVDTCTNISRLPSLGVRRNQILNNILLRTTVDERRE